MHGLDAERWSALEPHLDRALELEGAERQAWLAALEREAPGIAARVRALLAHREQRNFAGFLAEPAGVPGPDVPPQALASRRVGAYALERELGRGGMGSVWLARRADGQYQGKAAIKFLHAVWSGEEGQRRFRREGELLARLDHPNIARLLDAGLLDGSQPYLVLEYVQGERIDRWCEARRLDVRGRIRLCMQVAHAVAHAHRHLVIHRDLKPANILVTDDGTPKLLDFGIGKLLGDESGGGLTRAGAPALTPEYAAPEQVRNEPVTTATDVYALGLVLYELLTGCHAYGTVQSGGASIDLLRAVVEQDPKRASTAATVPALSRALRGDLDNILAKALHKNPSDRYGTAGALAEDLRRHLEHEPVSARAASAGYRAAKFVRRHRGAVASGALLVLTLVVSTAVTTTQMVEARQQRDEARFQTRRAESANEFLSVLLQTEGAATGSEAPTGTERLELGVRMLESQYAEDPRFEGRMLVELGHEFRTKATIHRAVELFERAYQLGRESEDLELMALARCAAAYAEAVGDAGASAEPRIVEAQQLIGRLESPSVELRVHCLRAEGVLADRRGDTDAAIPRLTEGIRLLEDAEETHRGIYVNLLTDLGGVHLRGNRLAEALELTERADATHVENGRGGTRARINILQNQAVTLEGLGEVRQAFELRSTAIRRAAALEGDGTPPPQYLANQAHGLDLLARPREALNVLAGPTEHFRTAGHRGFLARSIYAAAWAHMQLGEFREAQAGFDEAAQLYGANPSGNRDMLTRIDLRRAELALRLGDVAAARRHIDAAFAADGYPSAPMTRATHEMLLVAADVALREGRFDTAAAHASAALAISESVARHEDSSAHVGEALLRVARVKQARGEAGVQPLLERAVRCLTNGYGPEHPRTREARELIADLSEAS